MTQESLEESFHFNNENISPEGLLTTIFLHTHTHLQA